MLSSIDGWADISLAGGSWTLGAQGGYLHAGATGGTTAEAKFNRFTFFNGFDYVAFRIRVANVNSAVGLTGDGRFVFGDLASSYIGIRCYNDGVDRSIYGIVRDGVNAEQSVKLVGVTNDNGNPVECILTGTQVRFYRFGSIVGRIDLAQSPSNLGARCFTLKTPQREMAGLNFRSICCLWSSNAQRFGMYIILAHLSVNSVSYKAGEGRQ